MQAKFKTGAWNVEPTANRLLNGDTEVRLEPRVMQLLCVLAHAQGQVVSRAELASRVWTEAHVTDDAVTVAVYQLRRALGERSRNPEYLETVPKRGYRWLKPVEPTPLQAKPVKPVSSRPAVRVPLRWRPPQRAFWFAASLVAATLLAVAGLRWLSPQSPAMSALQREPESRDLREMLLRGWFQLNHRERARIAVAQKSFRAALEVRPTSPDAHAGLAASYCLAADLGVGELDVLEANAMRALRRAQQHGPKRPSVQYAGALCLLVLQQDVRQATNLLRGAVAGAPENPVFRVTLAWVSAALGHREQAAGLALEALHLDPTSLVAHLDTATLLAHNRQFAQAQEVLRLALELRPDSDRALKRLAWVLGHAHKDQEAYATYRQALVVARASRSELEILDRSWNSAGLRGILAWRADRLHPKAQGRRVWLARARLRARLGDPEGALADLGKARDVRDRSLVFVLDSPDFDSLRDDPRFSRLVRSVRPAI